METKQELLDLLNGLTSDQLNLVVDFIKSLQGDLNQEAFGFIVEHYDDTLRQLKDR